MGRSLLTDAPPRELARIAEELGRRGWSVIRTDDLEQLRVRAHVGDTHAGFRRDALAAMRRIRQAALDPRASRVAAIEQARAIADLFLRHHL